MKSKIDQYVINKVKEKRLEKDLSQADLSIEIGLSEGFIGQCESPKHKSHYNLKHLGLLAKALGCSPKDFLPDKPM